MKRGAGFVCFLCGAMVATVLTILLARGHDSEFARPVVPVSPAEIALNQTLKSVRIDNMTLGKAIAVLSAEAHIPIHWRENQLLVTSGLDTQKLSLNADQITLGQALRDLLDQFDTRDGSTVANLALWPEGGAVQIGDPADSVILNVYDLRDFDFDETPSSEDLDKLEVHPLRPAPSTVPVAAISGFGGPPVLPWPMDVLPRIITENIGEEEWIDNGGRTGRIATFGARLVVLQTWENQQRIRRLLDSLSPAMAPPDQKPVSVAWSSDVHTWDEARRQFVSDSPSSAEKALRMELIDVNIEAPSLENAVAMLGRLGHVDIIAHWEHIRELGIEVDKPIAVRASRITLYAALRRLLDESGETPLRLFVRPNGDWIEVSDSDRGVRRIYNLGNSTAGQLNLADRPINGPPNENDRSSAAMDHLLKLINGSVDSKGWSPNEGGLGPVNYFGSVLVVNGTWEVQEEVESVLTEVLRNSARPPASQPGAGSTSGHRPVAADTAATGGDGNAGSNIDADLKDAIFGIPDSKESVAALWWLFKSGTEVDAPKDIWFQGAQVPGDQPEIADLMQLQDCRLSRLNRLHYVFYGSFEATEYLYLLSVSKYPDDKARFVILACGMIKGDLDNDPGIQFSKPSKWTLPMPGPEQ